MCWLLMQSSNMAALLSSIILYLVFRSIFFCVHSWLGVVLCTDWQTGHSKQIRSMYTLYERMPYAWVQTWNSKWTNTHTHNALVIIYKQVHVLCILWRFAVPILCVEYIAPNVHKHTQHTHNTWKEKSFRLYRWDLWEKSNLVPQQRIFAAYKYWHYLVYTIQYNISSHYMGS